MVQWVYDVFLRVGGGGGVAYKMNECEQCNCKYTEKKKTIATHTHTAVCAASKINKRSAIGDFIVPESN